VAANCRRLSTWQPTEMNGGESQASTASMGHEFKEEKKTDRLQQRVSVTLVPLTFLLDRQPLVKRFWLDEYVKTAMQRRRVGVDGMKFAMKRKRLVNKMCEQYIRCQQLCNVQLHLVGDQNHQASHELHLITHKRLACKNFTALWCILIYIVPLLLGLIGVRGLWESSALETQLDTNSFGSPVPLPHHHLSFCQMPFLQQPSQFILAWNRHRICWLAYLMAWFLHTP